MPGKPTLNTALCLAQQKLFPCLQGCPGTFRGPGKLFLPPSFPLIKFLPTAKCFNFSYLHTIYLCRLYSAILYPVINFTIKTNYAIIVLTKTTFFYCILSGLKTCSFLNLESNGDKSKCL